MLEGIWSQGFLVAFALPRRKWKALRSQVLLLAPHCDTSRQSLEYLAGLLDLETPSDMLLQDNTQVLTVYSSHMYKFQKVIRSSKD